MVSCVTTRAIQQCAHRTRPAKGGVINNICSHRASLYRSPTPPALCRCQAFGEYSESSSSSSGSEEEDGSDSDNSSDSSGGEAGDSTSVPLQPPAPEEGGSKRTGPGVGDDDDKYLDSIISELARTAAVTQAAEGSSTDNLKLGASSPLALLLRCDPRCLKLDQELRRKFGGGDRENGGAAGGGGGGGGGRTRRTRRGMMVGRGGSNSVSASLTLKRLVVSAPKEDWPKPPSFVGGGLGMKRCEAGAPAYLPRWQLDAHQGAEWFVFERSSSLEQLQVTGLTTE